MGRKKGSGLFTGIVTVALAGVVALGAYKWDNLKPAILETKIYTQTEYDKQSSQIDQYKDMVQEQQTTIQDQQTTIDEQNELLNTKYYVATFISDGVVLENQILASGSTIEYTGETPTKSGYDFLGWSVDGETVIEENMVIENNVVLTPLWQEAVIVFNNMSLKQLVDGGYVTELSTNYGVTLEATDSFKELPSSELIIPEGIEAIRNFKNCTNITKFYSNANTLKHIWASCFSSCSSMTEAILPDSVETIGGRAFGGCNGLTKVYLSANLKEMANPFSDCPLLTSMYIPASVTKITDSSGNCGVLGVLVLEANLDFKFYCGATEKPDGWTLTWNSANSKNLQSLYEVVWGVTYDQYLEAIGG